MQWLSCVEIQGWNDGDAGERQPGMVELQQTRQLVGVTTEKVVTTLSA
jgi:hypothetical protein